LSQTVMSGFLDHPNSWKQK